MWLFQRDEIAELAQQHPKDPPRHHLFMHTDLTFKGRKDRKLSHDYIFQKHQLENRVHTL